MSPDMIDAIVNRKTRNTEVAALRAEVERLRRALDKIARHPWAARNPTASINERVRDMVSQIITTAATALQQPQGCVSAAPTGCVSDSECAAAGRCLEWPDALAAVIAAIQDAALERAAVVAETHQAEVQRNIDDNIAEVRVIQITPSDNWPLVKARDWLKHTAAAIRALKEGI
jgi:hypothetical protein